MTLINKPHALFAPLLALSALLLSACGQSDTQTPDNAGATLPDEIFLAQAPEGAQPITSLKATAKEGDTVVVRVIVGGVDDPIVKDRASATVIDASVTNPCVGEDDHCDTPWDYCCTPKEDKIINLATLQVSDEQGKVLSADLASRIKPLSTLIVQGVVGPRPNEQVLTINASGIYIEPEAQ